MTERGEGEKGNERPLKDNICYGEGRSVEGRPRRKKRLIEKDSEKLTADSRQQGSEKMQYVGVWKFMTVSLYRNMKFVETNTSTSG